MLSLLRSSRARYGIVRFKSTAAPPTAALRARADRAPASDADAKGAAPARSVSQPSAHTHDWLLTGDELAPGLRAGDFAARRAALAKRMPERALALLPAAPQKFVTGVVPYPYRACAALRYLTGLSGAVERDAVLAVRAGSEPILFLAPRDASAELWDGARLGPAPDVTRWLQLRVEPRSALRGYLDDVLPGTDAVFLDVNEHPAVAAEVSAAAAGSGAHPDTLLRGGANSLVDPLRLIKTPAECAMMHTSACAVAAALNDAMAQLHAPPGGGVLERDIAAVIEYSFARRGAERAAFPPVVAGGANATVLHYMANAQRVREGELVMVDAGCEMHGYVSDVSRTWPVSGRFSPAQRDLYTLVLDVHKRLLGHSIVGVSLDSLHVQCATELTRGLLDLGFMRGSSLSNALESGAYLRYFPHAAGHYLGMDVHDTHAVAKSIPLRPGMAITMEPGLYVPVGDRDAPEAFHGIGIRVEDDLIISSDDLLPVVLSKDAVKEIDDIEHLVGSAQTKWTPR